MLMNKDSAKRLSINMECIPASFLQRKLDRLFIYSVKKTLGTAVEDTYPGYMIETT
jgi:hypothetical protein